MISYFIEILELIFPFIFFGCFFYFISRKDKKEHKNRGNKSKNKGYKLKLIAYIYFKYPILFFNAILILSIIAIANIYDWNYQDLLIFLLVSTCFKFIESLYLIGYSEPYKTDLYQSNGVGLTSENSDKGSIILWQCVFFLVAIVFIYLSINKIKWLGFELLDYWPIFAISLFLTVVSITEFLFNSRNKPDNEPYDISFPMLGGFFRIFGWLGVWFFLVFFGNVNPRYGVLIFLCFYSMIGIWTNLYAFTASLPENEVDDIKEKALEYEGS